MTEELVELKISFFEWPLNDPSSFAEMESVLENGVPGGVRLEKVPWRPKKYETELGPDTVEEFLLERLKPEAYEKMGREYGDLEGLSQEELFDLALPFERGGGSQIIHYVFELLESDPSTTIAAISALTLATKQVVQSYFMKDEHRSITIKRGDDEVTVSGYSPEEANKIIEDFFAKIRREHLSDEN